MSYYQGWVWNSNQLQGFRDAMSEMDVDYQVIELDSKRARDQQTILVNSNHARNIIETWKPDLVYANDDAAQQYVTRHYVGTEIPFVFSAVNQNLSVYGLTNAKNITGVLEYEHFASTIELLRKLVPDVNQITVVVDKDPMWDAVIDRMRESLANMNDIEVTEWSVINTFAEYKSRILSWQDSVDAVAILGIFNFVDDRGKRVRHEDVLRWTAGNSQLPDFSFWESRTALGTLCAVSVSGYDQGYSAGTIAYRILHDGISPGEIPVTVSQKGRPSISLARANDLGLNIDSDLLMVSKVFPEYEWDEQ